MKASVVLGISFTIAFVLIIAFVIFIYVYGHKKGSDRPEFAGTQCAPLEPKPEPYNVFLYSGGVKPFDSVENFKRSIKYQLKFLSHNLPTLKDRESFGITHFQLILGPPAKPPSYFGELELIAEQVAQIPDTVRVVALCQLTYHTNWNIGYANVTNKYNVTIKPQPEFYGGNPDCNKDVNVACPVNEPVNSIGNNNKTKWCSDGNFHTPSSPCPDSEVICQPKNVKPTRPNNVCMQNVDIACWYVAQINRIVEGIHNKTGKKSAFITGLGYDSESGSIVSPACTLSQIRVSLDRYWSPSWFTGAASSGFEAAVSGGAIAAQTDGSTNLKGIFDTPDCGSIWREEKNPTNGKNWTIPVSAPITLPEFYWMKGQVVGGTAASPQISTNNMQSNIRDEGFLGCSQSGPKVTGQTQDNPYNYNCACRATVYRAFLEKINAAKSPTESSNLIDEMLSDKWLGQAHTEYMTALGNNDPNSYPMFSLEQLGDPRKYTSFATCVSTANQSKTFWNAEKNAIEGDPGVLCASSDCGGKPCMVTCGVTNFFGGYSASCFKRMLDAFVAKQRKAGFKVGGVGIYEAAFLTDDWVFSKKELEENPNPFVPQGEKIKASSCNYNSTPSETIGISDWKTYNSDSNFPSKYTPLQIDSINGGFCPSLPKFFTTPA